MYKFDKIFHLPLYFNSAKITNENELQIEIEDFGHGDEEWRRDNYGKKLDEILQLDQLIKENDGEIGYLNKDFGVKYFIILHSNKKPQQQTPSSQSNVIRLFPVSKK
jgi:hypothetical protein